MNGSPPGTPATKRVALTLIALFFVVAAPFYWRAVERPHGAASTPGVNEPLFVLDGYPGPWAQPIYLPFALFETPTALAWSAALGLAVAGAGMAAFMLGKHVRGSSALLAAVVYAFGGTAAGMMSRPALACVLAWTPWALAAAHLLARQPGPLPALLLGLALAFALLGGAVAEALPAVGLAVLVCLFAGMHRPRAWQQGIMRRSLWLMSALLCATMLAAPAWWPWLADTAATLPMAAFVPRHVMDVPRQILASATNDLPHAGYLGIAALLTAPAALTRRASWLFLALYAAGWAGVFYGVPAEGWLLVATACGAILTGYGADALLAPPRDWRSPFYLASLACALAIAAGLLIFGDAAVAGRTALLLAPILLAAVVRLPGVAVVATLLIVAITAGDLTAANRNRFPHPYFQTVAQPTPE